MGNLVSLLWAEGATANAQNSQDQPSTYASSGNSALHGVTKVRVNGGTMNVAGGSINYITNHHHNITVHSLPIDPPSPSIASVKEKLSLGKSRAIQEETYRNRIADTGLWILELPEFKEWINIHGRVLWATGMPGAGKTHLASCVIDHLCKLAAMHMNVSVAFFFFRHADPMSVIEVLESLVRQLSEASTSAADLVAARLHQLEVEGKTPTEADYVELLKAMSRMGTICFFILDGLDEAPRNVQFNVIDLLSSIDANVCIFSRPLDVMQLELSGLRRDITFLKLAAQDQDIELLIKEKIRSTPELRTVLGGDDAVKSRMIRKIKDKASGMFLHAALQIEDLRHCLNVQSIFNKLEAFPTNLDGMYLTTMRRIEQEPGDWPNVAKRALVWVVYAQHPLTVEELQCALATCPDTQTFDSRRIVPKALLMSVCCGLVTTDSNHYLRLIHLTAVGSLKSLLSISHPHPQTMLAATCTAYLIHHKVPCGRHLTVSQSYYHGKFGLGFGSNPFLTYAHRSLSSHIRRAEAETPLSTQITLAFLRQCEAFPAIFLFIVTGAKVTYLNAIHVAVWLGTLTLVRSLISADARLLSAQSSDGEFTPLMVAVYMGHKEIVTYLLNNTGLNPNLTDNHGRTALMHAVARRNKDIVDQLLKHNRIDIHTRDDDGRTALIHATIRINEVAVRCLLGLKSISINAKDHQGMTALIHASQQCAPGIVSALLDNVEIDINATDEGGATALMYASEGAEDIALRLLNHPNIDPYLVDRDGLSALEYAYNGTKPTIIKALLSLPGFQGNGPIDTVSRAIVELGTNKFNPELLTQLSLVDQDELTGLLVLACHSGNDDAVQALLAHPRIQVNGFHSDRTALSAAAVAGHKHIVQRLLDDSRIEVNIRHGELGWTALMDAAREGHKEVVELLLGARVEVNEHDDDAGVTALMLASLHGHVEVVRALLGYPGININGRTRRSMSALDYAQSKIHTDVVELLLQQAGIETSEHV